MSSRRQSHDEAFAHKIEGWVASAIGAGALDFDDLLCRLPGVYPAVVQEVLASETDNLTELFA
jgi:hypothetical protein